MIVVFELPAEGEIVGPTVKVDLPAAPRMEDYVEWDDTAYSVDGVTWVFGADLLHHVYVVLR